MEYGEKTYDAEFSISGMRHLLRRIGFSHIRLNLHGAVDPITRDVIVRQEDTINSAAVISLLKQIKDKNPNAETIYVICDNARYSKSKEVAK